MARSTARTAAVRASIQVRVTYVHPSRYKSTFACDYLRNARLALSPIQANPEHVSLGLLLEGFDLAVILRTTRPNDERDSIWIDEKTAELLLKEDWAFLDAVYESGYTGVVPARVTDRLREVGYYRPLLENRLVGLLAAERWVACLFKIEATQDLVEGILSVMGDSVQAAAVPDVDLSGEALVGTRDPGRLAAWAAVAGDVVVESRECLAEFMGALDEGFAVSRPPRRSRHVLGNLIPGSYREIDQSIWQGADDSPPPLPWRDTVD